METIEFANDTLTYQWSEELTNAALLVTRVEPHSMRCSEQKARRDYGVANAQFSRIPTPAAWFLGRLLPGDSVNRGIPSLALGASLFTGLSYAVILCPVAKIRGANVLAPYGGGNVLKRFLLALTAAALIAMLTATAAQAKGYWYWCWDNSSGSWAYCWWNSGGIGQESNQDSTAGEITQTFNIN